MADDKVTLTAPEQVKFLREDKGCTFSIVSEAEAEQILGNIARQRRAAARSAAAHVGSLRIESI